MAIDLTPAQFEVLRKFKDELPFYSRHCLKIIDKAGQLIPLVFNKAQMYIHERLEKQKRETGMVRAVILKGRQQGCTTYIQARYFHRTTFVSNLSAFVLAHHADSTGKIFSIAQKFRENLPVPDLQLPLTKDTERAMIMSHGSGYAVGTAGSAQIGRGTTVQLFHGSEVGFYENADQLSTGLLQAVADVKGTELIFESTANGPANFFYDLVMGAVAGVNGYEIIFIPWFWQDEYTSEPLLESELNDRERELYATYKDEGMTPAHLSWRRKKIASMGDQEWKFLQEYPCCIDEAFVKAEGRFFDLAKVHLAAKRKTLVDSWAPLVVGVDQGRTGDDTVIARRQGRVIHPFEIIPGDDGDQRDMRLAGRLGTIIERENPGLVVIDTTNEHGALDRLHELGYKKIVKGVHFGQNAFDRDRYRNKRVEMYFDLRNWFDDDQVCIPVFQKFITELGAIPPERESSNHVFYLVSKDDIIKLLKWSPNILDAAVLTFAYPVAKRKPVDPAILRERAARGKNPYRSSLRSLQASGGRR